MIILFIGLVVLLTFGNIFYYETRVLKEIKDPDIMKKYILLTFKRKYKI